MAYLAVSLLVDPSSELSILVTATIQADLKSDNFLVGEHAQRAARGAGQQGSVGELECGTAGSGAAGAAAARAG